MSPPPRASTESRDVTLRGADQRICTLWTQALATNGNGDAGAVRDRLTDASVFLRRAEAALDASNLR